MKYPQKDLYKNVDISFIYDSKGVANNPKIHQEMNRYINCGIVIP